MNDNHTDAPEDLNIIWANFNKRQAVTESGETLTVTQMFDEYGDETDDPAECVVFVCGPTSQGLWLTDEMKNFEPGGFN